MGTSTGGDYSNRDASGELSLSDDPDNDGDQWQMRELPKKLSILFVDDDLVLRKLFLRGIQRLAPDWDVHEAASGEAAINLVATHKFHLVFIDQYMASMEKQLLGTGKIPSCLIFVPPAN